MHAFSLSPPEGVALEAEGAGAAASPAVGAVVDVDVGLGDTGVPSDVGRGVDSFGRSVFGGSASTGRLGGVVEAGSGVGRERPLCSSSLPSLQASKASSGSRGRALESRPRRGRDIRRAAYTAWHNLARL
jgi:hypothetical protein